jgi:hypothetical protein
MLLLLLPLRWLARSLLQQQLPLLQVLQQRHPPRRLRGGWRCAAACCTTRLASYKVQPQGVRHQRL